MSWLKRRLPTKRWKRIRIYLASLFIILLAADMLLVQYWRHINIAYDTTRITVPLNAEGMPDYITAQNAEASQGVTPENNAAPDLLQLTGTEKFSQSCANTSCRKSECLPSHCPRYLQVMKAG